MIHLGSLVRIADREILEEALVGTTHLPEPMQFLHVGATARVVHVRFSADREPLFGLDGRPGLWRESWLSPLTC